MINSIEQWLGSLPVWLFVPILILIVIVTTIIWIISSGGSMFPTRKVYLGEKKHGKK